MPFTNEEARKFVSLRDNQTVTIPVNRRRLTHVVKTHLSDDNRRSPDAFLQNPAHNHTDHAFTMNGNCNCTCMACDGATDRGESSIGHIFSPIRNRSTPNALENAEFITIQSAECEYWEVPLSHRRSNTDNQIKSVNFANKSRESIHRKRDALSIDVTSQLIDNQNVEASETLILGNEGLMFSMKPGWAKEALEPGVRSVPGETGRKEESEAGRICRRENAYYCTSKGMVPGVLSYSKAVLTFEPDLRNPQIRDVDAFNFQCIITISDIWEVASIMVPKTQAVENLFNLPNGSEHKQPVWARNKSSPKTLNLPYNDAQEPSLALIQILLKQRSRVKRLGSNADLRSKLRDVDLRSRRESAHKLGILKTVPNWTGPSSKDTTPASTTYVEDFSLKNDKGPPINPRKFILFRVESCTVARDITRALLASIKSASDGSSHFTYVPYYSHEALDALIRCSSMGLETSSCKEPEMVVKVDEKDIRRDSDIVCDLDACSLLSYAMITRLSYVIPPTVSLRRWTVRFDTKTDGVSMSTLFKKLNGWHPAFICILDDKDHIFGGYSPDGFQESRHFYGNGESFVFSFGRFSRKLLVDLHTYHWSGKNDLFVYSNHDRLVFGSGGTYAFAIDGDLLSGTAGRCATYDNPILAGSEDFGVKRIQIWSFESL